MGEFGGYIQGYTVGGAFGYDTQEGFTLSVFQSLSAGVVGEYWISANFSFTNPYFIEIEPVWVGAGIGTPYGMPGFSASATINSRTGDQAITRGVGITDAGEIGIYWSGDAFVAQVPETWSYVSDPDSPSRGSVRYYMQDPIRQTELANYIGDDVGAARWAMEIRDDPSNGVVGVYPDAILRGVANSHDRSGLALFLLNNELILPDGAIRNAAGIEPPPYIPGNQSIFPSVPGETRTFQTESGPETYNVMETVDTPSGEQQVWVGSSYHGGGTSVNNTAQAGTSTTGQSTGGHQSGPGNGYLGGNSNSNSSNDDDDDSSNTNICNNGHNNDPDLNAAAGENTQGIGDPETTTGTTYVPTIPIGGPGTFPVRPNGTTTTSTTTTTTQIIGPQPILLDLDGNGIQLTDLNRSTVFMEGDEGLKNRTAWAGAGDGVLFYDTDGDNAISDIREYVFTEWDPTATDDLAALRSRFDTNGDGKPTGTELTGFKVMKTNADGSLTAVTLASLNITQINLTEDTTHIEMPDGSVITGQGTFVMGGVTRTLANATLATKADRPHRSRADMFRHENKGRGHGGQNCLHPTGPH